MKIEDFDFDLPEQLIAQTPLKNRTASRLLVMDRSEKTIEHHHFSDMIEYLNPGDCLVLNNTRVLPARLYGVKVDTGAKIECLLLHQQESDEWEVLIKPAKKVKVGTEISFGDGKLVGTCTELEEHGGRVVRFSYEGIFLEVLNELGEMPLPPYIKEQLPDQERYQTVYAEAEGSAAAPTAGLHFTEEFLAEIEAKGIEIAFVTLHVGLGTFRPVNVDVIEEHDMHSEFFQVSEAEAAKMMQAKNRGGRLIAVGTTSTRTLETIASDYDGEIVAASGWTSIFIYPPYQFKAIDGMITNFHLPKSTLIMLISALSDRDFVMEAYQAAIDREYRFFSFGDAMLII